MKKKREIETEVNLDPRATGNEAERLREDLLRRVVGQDEAINTIVNIYQLNLMGLSAPERTIGNLLFLGPSGSGKTHLVESLASSLLGSTKAVIKIDCAEFVHSHEIARLIGSPPGYLGHRETPPLLTQERLNQYHTEKSKVSFVLFDEIEKANESLWNLLLGVTDRGILTLGDNRKTDFHNSWIFMTSNVGAKELESFTKPKFGFVSQNQNVKVKNISKAALRRKFTPEFLNRIDKIVTFNYLSEAKLKEVLEIELENIKERISYSNIPFFLAISERAKSYILSQGINDIYGARFLKRKLEELLVEPLANLVASSQIYIHESIYVDFDGQKMTFKRRLSATATTF